ncbi:MAG: hypothetical protein IJ774_05900 [Selenomonadaceae bacterium]|nr:hypothetical protein [Selenomonadaceae bacterium]MBR1805909.1 hypothetical protein [Selenomonadaceae bacterium]
MARTPKTWLQIPLAPKYEINQFGDVRNIASGVVVKPWIPKDRVADKQVYLRIETGGKAKSFHVSGLLYYVHGIIPKRKAHSRIPVPVVVSHGKNERYCFDSIRQAANFLATRIPKTAQRIHTAICSKHPKEFHGWKINYLR